MLEDDFQNLEQDTFPCCTALINSVLKNRLWNELIYHIKHILSSWTSIRVVSCNSVCVFKYTNTVTSILYFIV